MSSTAFTIRRPQPQDWSEWLHMRMALWPDTPPDEHEAEMKDYLPGSSRDAAFVAAVSENQLIGFVEVSQRPYADGCDTGPVGYLEGLYVEPEFRRQGTASALVKAAEQWAGSMGCTEMGSDCQIDNQVSLQTHLSLGYSEAERSIQFCKKLPSDLLPPPAGYPTFLYTIRPARPGFFEGTTPEENEILGRHYQHLQIQTELGIVLLAGPCLDDTFGIVIFRAANNEQANYFMNSDPAVQARVMIAELHPFRVSLIRRMRER